MSEAIYTCILRLLPAWLLMLMAAAAAGGWAWRLRCRVIYLPPLGYKIAAAVIYSGFAVFYAMVQWSDWTTPELAALSRVVLALQLLNEINGHIFTGWVWYRKRTGNGWT